MVLVHALLASLKHAVALLKQIQQAAAFRVKHLPQLVTKQQQAEAIVRASRTESIQHDWLMATIGKRCTF